MYAPCLHTSTQGPDLDLEVGMCHSRAAHRLDPSQPLQDGGVEGGGQRNVLRPGGEAGDFTNMVADVQHQDI